MSLSLQVKFFPALALFLMMSGGALAADTTSEPAVLKLRFRDSETGVSIVPDSVLVNGKSVAGRLDETGKVDLNLNEGDHQVIVQAKGYKPMAATETALAENTPINVLCLDPRETPAEIRPEALARFIKPKGAALAGFVVDDTTGQPIEDVEITIPGTDLRTRSNSHGFYAVSVPLTDGGPLPNEPNRLFSKKVFLITKSGYTVEERRNVMLVSDLPKLLNVRMTKGGGNANVVDEEEHRGGLQRALFGTAEPVEHDPAMHDDDHVSTSEKSSAHEEAVTSDSAQSR